MPKTALLLILSLPACSSRPPDPTTDTEGESGSEEDPASGNDAPSGNVHPTGATGKTSGNDSGDSSDDGSSGAAEGQPAAPWSPDPGTSWQWQLTDSLDTSADVMMYDVDLFDVSTDVIDELHAAGRIVICYFSAGSHEDWRPDEDEFPPTTLGQPLDEWPGEHWVDIRHERIREVMAARLDLARERGCDGVEPDNVDGYANDTGFPLAAEDQIDYNRWLAKESHRRELSVGLKNDLDQVDDLVGSFDWALNEECLAYDECDRLRPFVSAGKAVFHVEYVDDPEQGVAKADEVCPALAGTSFSTLIKEWDLGAWGIACPGPP